jgi:RNA polymerase sigma-70 factor (ECF subfamily)
LGTPSYAFERTPAPSCDPLTALMILTAQGDRAAFKQVYDTASAQLFGVALSLMRRRDQAEDLLQEAFLAIWQKASQYAPERGTPMAWMAMIVRHRAIDRMRMAKRRPQETGIEAAGAHVKADGDAHIKQACFDVSKALATLPENHRTAVTLAFVEGLTHEELALRLNAPLGTVKSWVRRGLLAMKESLNS